MSRGLKGIAVPLVTPVDVDGQIAPSDLLRVVANVQPHVNILQPCLSSGEGWKLSDGQWQQVVSLTVRAAPHLAVYPGILGEPASNPIPRARFAAERGAAGITLKIPDFTVLGVSGAMAALKELARHSPLPLFLYNDQDITGDERLQALVEMCRLENVVAIKESSRQPAVARRLLAEAVPVAVFQGWEDCLYASGAVDGYALALANLEPALCAAMLAAPTEERQAQITEMSQRYGLFEEDWFRGIKRQLQKRGMLETDRVV